MKMFEKNKIEISKILDSEEVFKKIVLAIKNLMMSDVHISKLGVGGKYYKNYYDIMEDVINDDKNQIFYAKNITFSSFGQYIKQNMCNYGIYFHLKKDRIFITIFCGNGFLLEKNQQNFIEKFVSTN